MAIIEYHSHIKISGSFYWIFDLRYGNIDSFWIIILKIYWNWILSNPWLPFCLNVNDKSVDNNAKYSQSVNQTEWKGEREGCVYDKKWTKNYNLGDFFE